MSKFFINRPIVAIVIAILMTIVGTVTMIQLPIAQYPNIVPPEIQVRANYTGADAQTIEQSVATPIEQQMSGVDRSNYIQSVNANGSIRMTVNFETGTDPNVDHILTQMRVNQATSQLPSDVVNAGLTVQKSTTAPLLLIALNSPKGTYDNVFLANYGNINLIDQITRVPGISNVQVFGAGQYAMRLWVKPDQLAKLSVTVTDIINALRAQNTVNPAGQIGGEPAPPGQEFTYTVRSPGRLTSSEEFGEIVIRANPDGSLLRLKEVARMELGAQTYALSGRLDGKSAAVLACYQLPGTNAIQAAEGVKALMARVSQQFPADMTYTVSLDTTRAVTEGMNEIVKTLIEALLLVILVVFIFLQGWRATLIPLCAVPVSLIGTFMLFPLFGFTINTLTLFGLVLAIGLVVDDAIVVVEAVEHHIEEGMSPHDATVRAMEEVSGPVIGIALVLSAVFIPTAFIPGITGRLYQQFAVTIAVSVLLSAFNALTLSPALAALLLRPRKPGRGPLGWFFGHFNRIFGRTTERYVSTSRLAIRKGTVSMALLVIFALFAGLFGSRLSSGFLPEEDQGYVYGSLALPYAASMERTSEAARKVEQALLNTPGVEHVTTVLGFNLLSTVQTTFNAFFFIVLKPWNERTAPNEQYAALKQAINQKLGGLPEGVGFAFPPPAIPGIGTSGGVTLMLEDRAGRDPAFLGENVTKFLEAARKRPEIASASSTFLPSVPQVFIDVDRDKVLKQGVDLTQVSQTLQTFMGGYFVNYFNRFGRQWQVFVQAEGEFRTRAENVGLFYVRNANNEMVPLSTVTSVQARSGPEFTVRFNLYRAAQINATAASGYSSREAMNALEQTFTETMPGEMGYDYAAISFQEKKAQEGVSPGVIFGMSLLFVFLILAALYESWSLPFSVLLGTPIAVFGAFGALWARGMENNIYAQIGLVMLIGLAAKNAILIVEFAKVAYERGTPLIEAALEGARLRLRPIIMTSFAFILGCVPLARASGAGAVGRRIMGTTVIGGMLAATLIAIFLIPVMFYVIERLAAGRKPPASAEAPAKA
ncbi:MAG: hydrophobe/amphiphile efflux-1 family RND transporter [Verrucomicrobia bacterium]|nr:MAG: hydrophobe/amphiphile efflux-1 family RND transporter [Verrucomicrobiota bacterium]